LCLGGKTPNSAVPVHCDSFIEIWEKYGVWHFSINLMTNQAYVQFTFLNIKNESEKVI